MPWLDPQARLLRTLGVHWAPRIAGGDLAARPDPALAAPTQARGLEHQPGPPQRLSAAARPVPAPTAAVTTVPQVREPAPPAIVSTTAAPTPAWDWSALREAVAACEACGLCRTRKQTVFGVGSTRAHWMVLGEAPGEQEDLRGEPFVGAAGRLLDQMLGALGLTRADGDAAPADISARQQVYIANTLKCRPPGNRNPLPEEMAQCEPFLQRQLQLLQPRIILAMGRFAVQSLLRSTEPVGKLRGRVHQYRGVPLVVTYHPAYLLRNPADKARAWEDLCLAAATFEAHEAADQPASMPPR